VRDTFAFIMQVRRRGCWKSSGSFMGDDERVRGGGEEWPGGGSAEELEALFESQIRVRSRSDVDSGNVFAVTVGV